MNFNSLISIPPSKFLSNKSNISFIFFLSSSSNFSIYCFGSNTLTFDEDCLKYAIRALGNTDLRCALLKEPVNARAAKAVFRRKAANANGALHDRGKGRGQHEQSLADHAVKRKADFAMSWF